MSTQDQARWNERYSQQTHGRRHHPSPLLQTVLQQGLQQGLQQQAQPNRDDLAAKPVAWDVACGTGRNLMYLAQLGYAAVGIDIADVGLAEATQRLEQAGVAAQYVVHDLELPTLPKDLTSDPSLVIVFRYLNLDLLPRLVDRLAVGGRLIVEVHLQTDERVGGPGSARFRAAPGALRQAVLDTALVTGSELIVEHDYEGPITDPDGSPMALAQLVVRRNA